MVAILKVTKSSLLHLELLNFSANTTCILHKVCLLHAFSTWQRFMLNANALVGDWQCFYMFLGQGLETLALNDSISVHMTRWTPARYPGEGSGKKNLCMRLHEATYCISFPAFVHWRKSMKLYKMMPPTVCNLCFLLCNPWFLIDMS